MTTAMDVLDYCRGKKWYVYAPLWVVCAYLFYGIVHVSANGQAISLLWPFTALDFGLHESAHLVTAFFPPLITAASGSLSEILLGLVLVLVALKQRAYFAMVFCSVWFALGCKSAGQYMADARTQKLDLVSPFSDTAQHDWHFVFGRLHLLPYDTLIGGLVKYMGYMEMTLALGFGLWLLYRMAALPATASPLPAREQEILDDARLGIFNESDKDKRE
jgi:hypothetical protein